MATGQFLPTHETAWMGFFRCKMWLMCSCGCFKNIHLPNMRNTFRSPKIQKIRQTHTHKCVVVHRPNEREGVCVCVWERESTRLNLVFIWSSVDTLNIKRKIIFNWNNKSKNIALFSSVERSETSVATIKLTWKPGYLCAVKICRKRARDRERFINSLECVSMLFYWKGEKEKKKLLELIQFFSVRTFWFCSSF